MTETVSREDAIKFLEGAFRNIDLPPLSADDIEDVRDGLSHIATRKVPQKCSRMEIFGEDPNCFKHGRGTEWAKANPDMCELSETITRLTAERDALREALAEARSKSTQCAQLLARELIGGGE